MNEYPPEVQRLTEEIRAHLAAVYENIVELNERRGYLALGYPTMVECMSAEWGFAPLDAIEWLEDALTWQAQQRMSHQ